MIGPDLAPVVRSTMDDAVAFLVGVSSLRLPLISRGSLRDTDSSSLVVRFTNNVVVSLCPHFLGIPVLIRLIRPIRGSFYDTSGDESHSIAKRGHEGSILLGGAVGEADGADHLEVVLDAGHEALEGILDHRLGLLPQAAVAAIQVEG